MYRYALIILIFDNAKLIYFINKSLFINLF